MPTPKVHAFMTLANGGRNRTFTTADGIKVMVEAHEDDERAAQLAEFLAAAVATPDPEPTDLTDVCAALCRGRVVLGIRCSVGPYTPAVDSPFGWAVLDLRGAPITLAHDAFEAARDFVDFESDDGTNLRGRLEICGESGPREIPSDAQIAEWNQAERARWLTP